LQYRRSTGELTPICEQQLTEYQHEATRLIFWRSVLLDLVTSSVARNETKKLAWLTTDVLHFPGDYQLAVAEALYQKRWKHAKEPFAYVAQTTRTIYKKHYDYKSLGLELNVVSLNFEKADPSSPFAQSRRHMLEVEVLEDLHKALRALKLPPDVVELARASFHGIASSKVAADFGWTATRLKTARRRFDRAKEKLKLALAAYAPVDIPGHWRAQPRNERGQFANGKQSNRSAGI
jgi:hypothetical protein